MTDQEIQEIIAERDKYKDLLTQVNKLANWEQAGAFIHGKAGRWQDQELSEILFVVPAYGADVQATMAYWRNDVVKELREDNSKMKETLSFYADDKNYGSCDGNNEICYECGQKAKETLKNLK